MADKNDSLRFTIHFNKNDPRHIQAAQVLNQKGQRSKAVYLVNAILQYENLGTEAPNSAADLTAQIESIVLSILQQEKYLPAEQAIVHETPPFQPDMGIDKDVQQKIAPASIERALQELGENGIKSIAEAMARLRGK